MIMKEVKTYIFNYTNGSTLPIVAAVNTTTEVGHRLISPTSLLLIICSVLAFAFSASKESFACGLLLELF